MIKFKFIVHPLFIIFASVLVYLNYFFLLLSYLVTIILHECAHAYVAYRLGYKLNQINLMPHGASLSGESKFFSPKDEIAVAVAGPMLNIILATVGCAIWWIWPTTYFYTLSFVYANLCTALINCLPIFPLDGGRVLLAFLGKRYNKEAAQKKVRVIGIVISSLILVLFCITLFFTPNFTLLMFGAFLLATSILKDKEAYYNHMGILESKSNYINKGLRMRNVAVPEDMPLYKLISTVTPDSLTEFTVINTEYKVLGKISELELQRLIQIYPANTALGLIVS